PSPDAEEKQDPRPKSAHEVVQKVTSSDRILWTLPNFLTMENAKNVPPLTPGQKFKVTARGLFDPFEFRADRRSCRYSPGSRQQSILWTGHGGIREALRHSVRRQFDRELHVECCSAVDPAPGPALLPTGPRRFLATERSRR